MSAVLAIFGCCSSPVWTAGVVLTATCASKRCLISSSSAIFRWCESRSACSCSCCSVSFCTVSLQANSKLESWDPKRSSVSFVALVPATSCAPATTWFVLPLSIGSADQSKVGADGGIFGNNALCDATLVSSSTGSSDGGINICSVVGDPLMSSTTVLADGHAAPTTVDDEAAQDV